MADSLELSIVLPCLNEARTLPVCLEKARQFLKTQSVHGEIIVADNGSTDGSAELAKTLGARVVPVAEKGYGAALAGGIAAAKGRYVIMGDADDSYDFLNLMPLLEKLREGIQLVVGNRFKGGIAPDAMPFLNRYFGNPFLSFIGRLFFKIPLRDFHCGLRGFSREALLSLGLQTKGMEYASEMIVRAALMELSIAEVPVTLSKDGRDRRPHLHPWRDGWRHLRFLLIYSPEWLYLYPGLFLIAFGLLIGAVLLPGPLMLTQKIGVDVHTLLVGGISILVGAQSLTFGVMARFYAKKQNMIPRCSRLDGWIGKLKLEPVLLAAAFLFFCGLTGIFWAMSEWSSVHFGALDYRAMMRILIFATTCVVGGFQLGFTAFFLGIMRIEKQ